MSYVTDNFDDKVIELLLDGGIGFMPSDTIYGLSARALDEKAVRKIHELKARELNKPFIILIADIVQAADLGIESKELEPALDYWPGALTVVCKDEKAPAWLQLEKGSLAVRLPAHRNLRNLIKRVGPIISTSANQSGEPAILTPKKALEFFGEQLDFYVDAGPSLLRQPSTIVRFDDGNIEIIRQGPVKIVGGEKDET